MHTCTNHIRRSSTRRGLTMPELLIASTIVAMMLAALGSLAVAVDSGHEYSYGRSTATQHARVASQRISRHLNSAHANEEFPGFVVFRETSGSFSFPDLLIVWHPEGNPANPEGLPLASELVAYCPNPKNPAELWEVTDPDNASTVPTLSDSGAWATVIDYLKTNDGPTRTVVTDLLKTANVSNGSDSSETRGAVRFEMMLRPTDAQIQQYTDGNITWSEVPWVQSIHGETTGLRQAWCSVELQLVPGNWSASKDPQAVTAIPFFSSGAVYYEVSQ